MRKAVKIIGIIVAVPVFLFIILAALFYFPPFQSWAVKRVTSITSEKTGMEITVERVNLSFPFDLSVDGIKVLKPNDTIPQQKDTIADIKCTIVDIQLLPLFMAQVEIDELDIQNIKFNTSDFIPTAHVKGAAKRLSVKSHGINLKKENVVLDNVMLDGANISLQLLEAEQEDTIKSENNWAIALKSLLISNSRILFNTIGDTITVGTDIKKVSVHNGHFDLGNGVYELSAADMVLSKLTYDNNLEPHIKGLDTNHIRLSDVALGVDSVHYATPDLFVKVRKVNAKEEVGLELRQANGIVKMDSAAIHLPSFHIATPYSYVHLNMDMDLNAFDEHSPGRLWLKANGQLAKNDIMFFAEGLPQKMTTSLPHYPLSFECDIEGNMRLLSVNRLSAELPTAFKASAKGHVSNVLDTDNLLANLNLDITTYNVAFATNAFLDPSVSNTFRIPNGTNVKGFVNAKGKVYDADAVIANGRGWAKVKGHFNSNVMSYNADIVARSFPLHGFLPGMEVTPLSGRINVAGNGTDIFSPKMRLDSYVKIDHFAYSGFDISSTQGNVRIRDGRVHADLNCDNKMLRGDIAVDALMSTKNVRATLGLSLDKADLQAMKFVEFPLTTEMCAHVDVASDVGEYYKVQGFVSDVMIQDSANTYRPANMNLDITTRSDTTWALINSGDLDIDLSASGSYKQLMKVAGNLSKELTRQIDRKYISQDSLKQVLPIGHIKIHSGKNNILAHYAGHLDYAFKSMNADINLSPEKGINGYAQIDSLFTHGMQLDKVRLDLATDESGFKYKGQIYNDKKNPQYSFNALFDGSLFETGSDVSLRLYDEADKLALRMGLRGIFESNGIRVKLADINPILGYRKFTANDDNYLFLADDNRMSANMILKADDGTGLQIYSNDDHSGVLQDVTIGINHLDLASIVSIVPYMPKMAGVLNGDFHVIQTEKELSVSSSLAVNRLVYEGNRMGNLSSEFVYMPLDNGKHYVDAIFMHNGNDVGTIKGTYSSDEKESAFDAKLNLARLPLSLLNGFFPDQILGLRGYGDGELDIHGPLSNLSVNGELQLDSAFLFSVPYGVEMSFDDRPVEIKNSRLVLENFNMYANNRKPLVLNGYVNFADIDKMSMHMRMNARNFLLIDSKESRRSEAFGRAYVNFNALASGPLSALKVRGKLDVLGSSDITYIMRDTPLSTDNRLDDLVKFTDFNDSKEETIVRPTIEGLYVDLGIDIDQGARVFCALNAIKSNYVDITGGGELRFVMRGDEMRMTGRYTIADGEMKYSLPVIPLQTFTIDPGSYVEFSGDVMNPKLNITANETIRANVNEEGNNRIVQFRTGVVLTKTLNDMGLEFIIDAPEDMAIHSNLQTMSKEERGKIAVTMLTTGMYFSSGNTSAMSMNSAFNSFLQSEINSITGNALRTLDLSIGLDNITDEAGQLHTDYSFKFAKRFWNNRVRLVVGGKVSSGTSQTQSLFDNLALEYRLSQRSNTNLKLFYERQVYDYLEGYIGQYGIGIVWKRKLERMNELFDIFRKRKKENGDAHIDSTTVEKKGDEEL